MLFKTIKFKNYNCVEHAKNSTHSRIGIISAGKYLKNKQNKILKFILPELNNIEIDMMCDNALFSNSIKNIKKINYIGEKFKIDYYTENEMFVDALYNKQKFQTVLEESMWA